MNREELNTLKTELKLGIENRKRAYSDGDWQQFEDYWESVYPGSTDIMHTPIMVSDASRQKASLVGAMPRAIVQANRPDQVAAARILQAKINKRIKKSKLNQQIEDCIQDAQTLGTGFMLDGFGSQYGVHRMTGIQGFDQSRFDEKTERIEYNSFVEDDQPWSLRTHPSTIIIPLGVTRIEDCPGFYRSFIRSIKDVQADEKYIRKHRMNITADSTYALPPEKVDSIEPNRDKRTGDYVTLWDYYDFKRNRRVTFTDNYNYPLADHTDEIMIRINRLPLHALLFNRNSRRFWGTSDFDFQEATAQEYNDIRTVQTIMRRLQIPKIFYNLGMLQNADDIKKLNKAIVDMKSDEIMAMIGINGDPREFIVQVTPTANYDFMAQLDLCRRDIEQFGMGVGRNQKGIMSSGRHSATEAKITDDNQEEAVSPRRSKVVDLIIEIVENWIDLTVGFQTQTELIPVYDATGHPVVVEFKGVDLVGDYDVDIQMDSMRARSKNEEIEQANMVLSQLTPFAQAGIVNGDALARQYLTHVTSDWDIESLMTQPGMQANGPVSFEQYQQMMMQQAQRQRQQPPNMAALMSSPFMQAMQNKAGVGGGGRPQEINTQQPQTPQPHQGQPQQQPQQGM